MDAFVRNPACTGLVFKDTIAMVVPELVIWY